MIAQMQRRKTPIIFFISNKMISGKFLNKKKFTLIRHSNEMIAFDMLLLRCA